MLYNLFENRDFVSVFAVALLAEGVDRNIYTPGEKTGMVLKMKWVEGSHYWESSIRILEKLYPELLEKKLQSWLDEYFKDFL